MVARGAGALGLGLGEGLFGLGGLGVEALDGRDQLGLGAVALALDLADLALELLDLGRQLFALLLVGGGAKKARLLMGPSEAFAIVGPESETIRNRDLVDAVGAAAKPRPS